MLEQILLVMESFTSASENETDNILKDNNTLNKGNRDRKQNFQNYLTEKMLEVDIINTTISDLNNILRKCYVAIRKVNGGHYTKTSVGAIYTRSQRRFKEVYDVDIIVCKEFTSSNEVFRAQCV